MFVEDLEMKMVREKITDGKKFSSSSSSSSSSSYEFFTPALVDGLSLEAEWQQVSSSLKDSSQNSGRSQ